MVMPAATATDLIVTITEEIRVNAPLEVTFDALLEELGKAHAVDGDKPMPMKLEAWPGGRWYRDLGDDNGHLWGHVQAIKRPTLLEFTGPLFMSFAAANNVQYRLAPVDGGTLITFKHSAMGVIPEEQRAGMLKGWADWHERVRKGAERAARS
jgi:hypothetical protein